jgi:hypothetical protein
MKAGEEEADDSIDGDFTIWDEPVLLVACRLRLNEVSSVRPWPRRLRHSTVQLLHNDLGGQ